MGLQPVVLRRSFHPFPQHGGTSIHKVDVVGAQHGCSTSHRSHDQDTRCEEVCATVTLKNVEGLCKVTHISQEIKLIVIYFKGKF